MQLTNFSGLEHDGTAGTSNAARFDDDFGYTDEETFDRPRIRRQSHRDQRATELARHRASAMDDDELADIALHFGER